MSNTNKAFYNKVKKIHKSFSDLTKYHSYMCMESRPRWCHYHNDELIRYGKGVEICERYFVSRNELEFVEDLNSNTFFAEVLQLKHCSQNPNVLEQVRIAEAEFEFETEFEEVTV